MPGTAWRYLGDQQRLTDNNLIHMGARDYNPTLGRFLQVDPIEGGCANNYVYVNGDPISQTDVSGKTPWDWIQDNIITCEETTASSILDAFSLVPEVRGAGTYDPYNDAGIGWLNDSSDDWAIQNAGWANYGAGKLVSAAGGKYLAVRAFSKASGVLTAVGTGYAAIRSVLC